MFYNKSYLIVIEKFIIKQKRPRLFEITGYQTSAY